MNEREFSKHSQIQNVKIDDSFWNKIIEVVRENVIPYQYFALQDKIDGAEKSFCIENFVKAGKVCEQIKNGISPKTYPVDKWHYDENNTDKNAFHGWVFQDSDVYKWIEAVGYSLQNFPDKNLEKKAKEYIDIICNAQLDNGYLDTLYIINDRSKVFTNLKDYHELYCFGHLAEGAISFYKATGDRKLFDAACRFADLICNTFGENKIKGYPGHETAELALVKLYNETGKKEYLDTAKFFIDERGKKPYYFDIERGKEAVDNNYSYNQAHIPPREQREAVGHAVRGVYLYSAMADIAKAYNDDELFNACKSIWDNIENRKMYITGGIGANADAESFSFDYDLPNDLAYAETCASIGLIFFAARMSENEINSHYADVIERALYNTVLSGMAEDGKSFFYVNPLEVLPIASKLDSRKKHIKPVRQKWYSCACCPPNLSRLVSSLNEYIFTENDNT
ncbi:MAG: glycoside hydrolase family 127 protein, partial [Eubacterium sp.]